jgi:hypothetical protein
MRSLSLHFTPVDQNTHRRDAEGAEILENPPRLGGEKLLGDGSRPQKCKDRGDTTSQIVAEKVIFGKLNTSD